LITLRLANAATLDMDIGPYRIRLPTIATVPASSEPPVPFKSVPLARIGPFEISASLDDGTLEEWREFVGWTTKYRAKFLSIEVNGIPGLTLAPSDQRLDYAFKSAGIQRIDLVAWSDSQTTPDQRRIIEETVETLRTIKEAPRSGHS
jgi:hypothetical protein